MPTATPLCLLQPPSWVGRNCGLGKLGRELSRSPSKSFPCKSEDMHFFLISSLIRGKFRSISAVTLSLSRYPKFELLALPFSISIDSFVHYWLGKELCSQNMTGASSFCWWILRSNHLPAARKLCQAFKFRKILLLIMRVSHQIWWDIFNLLNHRSLYLTF